MENMKEDIAKILLDTKAITINTTNPYTYTSGIRSPIYCDNRVLIYHVKERKKIIDLFVEKIKDLDIDVIAGTATSAIPWACWIAEKLNKPTVYIRKRGKGYGKDKLVEGGDINDKKVVVVEDLVSTGGSSFNAVQACIDVGADVKMMAAIFTYEFENSKKRFEEINCKIDFLTNFSTLVKVAADNNFIEKDKLELIQEWNKDPKGWGPKYGFPNKE